MTRLLDCHCCHTPAAVPMKAREGSGLEKAWWHACRCLYRDDLIGPPADESSRLTFGALANRQRRKDQVLWGWT